MRKAPCRCLAKSCAKLLAGCIAFCDSDLCAKLFADGWLNSCAKLSKQISRNHRPMRLARPTRPTSPSAKREALRNGVVHSVSWSAGRCFAIQLSKIKLAHSSATFQVRKHTFKASVACNGREVLRGTPVGRHGISAREAADCLGNREPSTADRCAERVPPAGRVPENTSRPALCGASPWGGLPEPKYLYASRESHAPLVERR